MRKPDTGPGFARLCGVLVLILAAELSAVGQAAPSDPDQSELAILLLRMEAARSMNWKIEREYVSDDQAHGVDYNLHGKKIREYTQKLGWIQIGDELCRRLMEENGKPPSEKRLRKYQLQQAGVNQLTDGMEFVVDLEDGAPQDSVFSALPICCLATLFDSRFLRHEVIDGRDNLVVESMPKSNPGDVSPQDRTALDWKQTTWIDTQTLIPVRYEVELLKNKKFLLKGTRERHDYFLFESPAQVNGAPAEKVWLLRSKTGSYNTQFLWAHKFSTFEDACSNYTRFKPDVEFVPILSLSSKAAEYPASRF